MQQFPARTNQFILVDVLGVKAGLVVNPTSDVVKMAIVAGMEPKDSDFKDATWVTDNTTVPNPTYSAQVRIGGNSDIGPLGRGVYNVFVDLVDDPEEPVLYSGQIEMI